MISKYADGAMVISSDLITKVVSRWSVGLSRFIEEPGKRLPKFHFLLESE